MKNIYESSELERTLVFFLTLIKTNINKALSFISGVFRNICLIVLKCCPYCIWRPFFVLNNLKSNIY